jgi:hypothetical protein
VGARETVEGHNEPDLTPPSTKFVGRVQYRESTERVAAENEGTGWLETVNLSGNSVPVGLEGVLGRVAGHHAATLKDHQGLIGTQRTSEGAELEGHSSGPRYEVERRT